LIFALIFSLTGCTFDFKEPLNNTITTQNSFSENLPQGFVIDDEWNLIVFSEKREIPIILSESNNITWKCVPVISLLQEIGVEVLYNKDNIKLMYNNKALYIDFYKEIIHTKDSEFNILNFPVGGEIYYKFTDYDIISCGPSFVAVCHFLGLDLSCVISDKNKTIEIDYIEDNQVTDDRGKK